MARTVLLAVVAAALLARGVARLVRGRSHAKELRSQAGPPLPDWAVTLGSTQFDELQQLLQGMDRRTRVAEHRSEDQRRRASQSLNGMWQIMSSAVTAEERVRGRFVADLHDGVVQSVIACTFMVEDDDIPRAELAGYLRDAESELRNILALSTPPELCKGDLAAAAGRLGSSLKTRQGLTVDWTWPASDVELPETVAITLYRFFQEALHNVTKHAGVSHARASLEIGAEKIAAWVRDEGCGFDALAGREAVAGDHVGLALMSDRAQQVGADVVVDSALGCGTTVTLTLQHPPAGIDRPVPVGHMAWTR
jgi:signal transduction histidine kinase